MILVLLFVAGRLLSACVFSHSHSLPLRACACLSVCVCVCMCVCVRGCVCVSGLPGEAGDVRGGGHPPLL